MLLGLKFEWALCAVEVIEKYTGSEILVACIIWTYTEVMMGKCLSYYRLTWMWGTECTLVAWQSVSFKSRCDFLPVDLHVLI